MTVLNPLKISRVDCLSPLLPLVKILWRSHANTLGFFPDGAFETYAEKKLILVATDSTDNLLGYLLYRITPSRNDASIVHLCIDKKVRGQGVASLLVKELFNNTKSLRGVGLKCRRDFEANKLWPKLGFVAVSENAGKSSSGSTLTRWWYDHNHPNLFSLAQDADLGKKRKVVIDANIFYDLKKENNEETMALTADWLDDTIAICISDELLNEINRASSYNERESCRAFSTRFPTLKCDSSVFDETFALLKKFLPANPSVQDRSDFTHLAKAIAANADFFVTRDNAILDKSNEVYEQFSMPILRPSDLISEIDALYRESEYQPARLAGTLYGIIRVQSKSVNLIVGLFQNQIEGEKQNSLRENLRKFLSSPHDLECYVALDLESNPIGLVAINLKKSGVVKIELLRVVKKHPLASTIIRFLISRIIKRASSEKCNLIHIVDRYLDTNTHQALIEDHFISSDDGWYKISLHEHVNSAKFVEKLTLLSREHGNLKQYCLDAQSELINAKVLNDIAALSKVEALLSPGLITDSNIPCFIVPIKPYWAQQLFDENLAAQDLFGAKVDLALNREAIYYRSIKNSFGIGAPARIIWYVSQNDKFPGSGGLRAHSRLEEVIVGYPKQLFRQFRRLGIYEWKDVIYTAKSDTIN
jgi:predicted nucleic acid-binding protein/GNAT superfamily N-acetyltransferase